jgi:hypothetical protein
VEELERLAIFLFRQGLVDPARRQLVEILLLIAVILVIRAEKVL